jgi:hypothetical protein
MARQPLTVQRIKSIEDTQTDGEGTTITYTAAHVDGFYVNNDGWTSVRLRSSGTPATVTVPHPGNVGGLAIADLVVTLAATDEQELLFLGPGFNQPDTYQFYVNFSAVTGVTVAAVSYRSN